MNVSGKLGALTGRCMPSAMAARLRNASAQRRPEIGSSQKTCEAAKTSGVWTLKDRARMASFHPLQGYRLWR